jgi:class 3 adenylate cyclase
VPLRKAAGALVDYCIEKKCDDELVKVIIEMDGKKMMGKTVVIPELEIFLAELAQYGFVYDPRKRKLRKTKEEVLEMSNWGALRNGREYEMTIISIDISDNSELVNSFGMKKMEKMYFRFWKFLRRLLTEYDGRIWNWAGDGGILAFALKDHTVRAVRFALEVQTLGPVFCTDPRNPITDDIWVRMGIDTGNIKYNDDTGRIVSDTINFAAHVEKQFTESGGISLSEKVFEELSEKLKKIFCGNGEFEERTVYYICAPRFFYEKEQ